MNKKIFCVIIAAVIYAAAFTSCDETANKLKMSSAEEQKNAVITALSTRSDFSDFVEELKVTDFSDLEADELTVFAVVNCNSTDEMECEPAIVKRHIVAGKFTRSELSDSLQLTALDGTLLLVTVNTSEIYVNGMKLGNEISVGKSVVHIVEGAIPVAPPTPVNPNVPVTGLMLNQSSITLKVGETEYIAMLFQPHNATNQNVTWLIDRREIAEVTAINYTDSLFSITGISAGTANVVFTTADGGYTATCAVTVTDKTDPGNGEDDGQTGCDQDVIISQTEFESNNTPRSPLNITEMKITGNCLKIKFSAGGCDGNTWVVKLIDSGIVESMDLVVTEDADTTQLYNYQRHLLLSLDNNEECKALITKEISFNIEDLQSQGTNKIKLNFINDPEKWILYKY